MQNTYTYNSTSGRKIQIVLDRREDYSGGTPAMVYLFSGRVEYCATWNCLMNEGTVDDQALTNSEWAWINSKTNNVNAFLETLEVA